MKTRKFMLRFTEKEFECYKEMVADYQTNMSEYIRQILMINHHDWMKRRKKCSKIGK